MTVKAGQTITLESRFEAEPEPTATWLIKSDEVKPDERISIKNEPYLAKLVIRDAKRSDTGKFTLKLTNLVGSDSASCEVTVLSEPGKPNGPLEVKDVKKFKLQKSNISLINS